jgi:hypothetical protein
MPFQESCLRGRAKCCRVLANEEPMLEPLFSECLLPCFLIDIAPSEKQFHLLFNWQILLRSELKGFIDEANCLER